MADERRAERAGYKADGVDAERLQRSDQRVGRGEIQFRENQRGNEHLSRKSYDSITEPTVEATTARRNCTLCSAADRFLAEILTVAIAFLPVTCISQRPEPSWALFRVILSRRSYGNKRRRSAPQSR